MTFERGKILPDTHALVWYLTNSDRLSSTAGNLMNRAQDGEIEMVVPTIVLAELLSISERKDPGISFVEALDRLTRMASVVIVGLDLPVISEAVKMPASLEMHDRLIAATAHIYGARLVSRDRQLSNLIQTIW